MVVQYGYEGWVHVETRFRQSAIDWVVSRHPNDDDELFYKGTRELAAIHRAMTVLNEARMVYVMYDGDTEL